MSGLLLLPLHHEHYGMSAISAYAVAQRALNDAIAQDAARHPEELIWYPA